MPTTTRVPHPWAPKLVTEAPDPATVIVAWHAAPLSPEWRWIPRLLLAALVFALGLAWITLTLRPETRYVAPEGQAYAPTAIYHGALRGGNSAVDLDSALATGTAWILLGTNLDPATIAAHFDTLLRHSTPAGQAALRAAVLPAVYGSLILNEHGRVVAAPFGATGWAWGERPGRIHVVVPLIGRYWGAHVPFDGALSGIPLGDTVEVTLRKGPTGWTLDNWAGGILDSTLMQRWTRLGMSQRTIPWVVIGNHVFPPGDSLVRTAWSRGAQYRNQN